MRSLLVASLVALSAPIAADTVAAGFKTTVDVYPTGATVRNMKQGPVITCDGLLIQRWLADGTFEQTLGSFNAAGAVGAMVIDPTESSVLVGNADTGEMLLVDLTGGGQTPLGTILNNKDAAFESETSAIVSASTCGNDCGNLLIRLDTTSGTQTELAAMEGLAGPVAVDNLGDVFYGTLDPSGAAGTTDIVSFTQAELANPPSSAFQINDGLIVIEVESSPPNGDWAVSTAFPGFTGDSYYRWDGPDLFFSPGSGILSYEFEVLEAGNYRFRYHNRHEAPQPDQANDAWVRVDGGQWLKIFSNQGSSTVAKWNWHSVVDEDDGTQYQANYDLTAGKHTVEISGRSNGFKIDRMVFFRDGDPEWEATDLANPESPFVPFNIGDADVLAAGLDDATEMVYEPKRDILILAENNSISGFNRLANINKLGVVGTYVLGDTGNAFGNLDFNPENGDGIFFPFQPAKNGELAYTRTDFGALNERLILDTRRPTLKISGDGSITGIGDTTVKVTNAIPNGFVLLVLAPAALVSPVEIPIPIAGVPIFTGLNLSAATVLEVPIPCDSEGTAVLNFDNQVGAPDVFGVQAVITDALGLAVGSSSTDFL
ncbi:MAG: hypothetical protein AAF682_17335 [Planctomycetota bacterium]